jgi:hypothetical protein
MKRNWMWMGLILAVAACGSDDEAPKDDGDGDSDGEQNADGDADGSADGDADGSADGDADGSADGDADGEGSECVDDSADTVSDPGFSCNTGDVCHHFIGSNWTEAEVQAACERSAMFASAEACLNEGFCARTTDTACRTETEDGKVAYLFGTSEQVCGFAMGTVVAKPAAGWPESYADLEASE